MKSKEILLGGILGTEIQRMNRKFEFYGMQTGVPAAESWVSENALTLDKFLEQNPIPDPGGDITLYGIAWEFIWGKKPPTEIADAKETLKAKARMGMEITETEMLWLKIMSVDTDMF